MADLDRTETAVAGCDVVFHVAAKAGIWGRMPTTIAPTSSAPKTSSPPAQTRRPSSRLHQFASVVFDGRDMEGVEESEAVSQTLRSSVSSNQSGSRKTRIGGERRRPRHGGLAAAPDLGSGRPSSHPAHYGRGRQAARRMVGQTSSLTVFISTTPPMRICSRPTAWRRLPVAGKAYFLSNGEPSSLMGSHQSHSSDGRNTAGNTHGSGMDGVHGRQAVGNGVYGAGRRDEPPMTGTCATIDDGSSVQRRQGPAKTWDMSRRFPPLKDFDDCGCRPKAADHHGRGGYG